MIVEYSPENHSAVAYHRVGVPCGSKPDKTPFEWNQATVEQAKGNGYRECRQCFHPTRRRGFSGRIRTPFGRV